jgi:molecular chaperone GrpE (heat shock protein)
MSRHSPTERIILSHKAWRKAARLLQGRCQRLREVARLQEALDSANERCNRIQADGNALAEQLHAWRQACQDHGIQPTPEALRAVLRRVDAACVAEADL